MPASAPRQAPVGQRARRALRAQQRHACDPPLPPAPLPPAALSAPLSQITGGSSVPRVFIDGKFIGE